MQLTGLAEGTSWQVSSDLYTRFWLWDLIILFMSLVPGSYPLHTLMPQSLNHGE